jgi:hypothetical protein
MLNKILYLKEERSERARGWRSEGERSEGERSERSSE